MRMLSTLALLLCASHVRAELSFDLRETVTGHPSLVLKSTEVTSHMFIKGGKTARRQNQIVSIQDNENNLLTLIDYGRKKFARSNLEEVRSRGDLEFDRQFPQNIRTELIASGQPAEWNGRATKQDVFRIKITGDPGPGEWLITVDSSAEPPPGFEETSRPAAVADDRYDQELAAEIQTLAFIHVDRFKDIQKARKGESLQKGLVIHYVAEFRLKKGAPLLETIGQEFADQPLMRREMEAVNLSFSPIDSSIFLVPPGFEQVESGEFLGRRDIRVTQ